MVVLRAWELTFRKSGAPASARCTFFEDWFPGFQPLIFQRNRKIAPDGPTPPKSLAYIIISGRFSIDFARLLSWHGLTYITNLTHLQTHSPTWSPRVNQLAQSGGNLDRSTLQCPDNLDGSTLRSPAPVISRKRVQSGAGPLWSESLV